MTRARTEGGRAGLWVVLTLALGAVAYLLINDPLGILGAAKDRDGASGGDGASLSVQAGGAGASTKERTAVTLESLYGSGDLGSVALRVMDAGTKKARAALPIRLRSRAGTDTVLPTDPDGAVHFMRLAPGRGWQVLIEGAGFRAVTLEGVAVKPGATTDLGEIWVGQNVVLRGRVLDPAGRPLPDASVAAYAPATGTPGQGLIVFLVNQALELPNPKEQVVSDADGWFRFAALADGKYSLVARHAGFGTRQQNDIVVSARSGSTPIVVRLGTGARLSGSVKDADGKPVAGARVVALRDLGQRFSLSGTLERDEAVSDPQGKYVLDTLVEGASYRLGVVAEAYASAWDQQPTEVQRVAERDFTLQRGGYVEGRVTEEGTGTPVADASVTVVVGKVNMGAMGGGRPGRGGPGGAGGVATGGGDPTTPAVARTDAQGRFRIGPLLPGPVMSAVVKAPGYSAYTSSNFGPFTANPWPDVTVDAPVQIDVALKRGGAIEGVVRDAEGAPVAGASVIAAGSGPMGMTAMWSGSPATTTDPQGRYHLDGVLPGEYHLTADAPGFSQAEAGEDATKAVMPEQGGTLTLDLVVAAAGVVTGAVKDGKGEPLAGVRVRTRPDFGGLFGGRGGRGGMPAAGTGARMLQALRTAAALTDAQGQFRLEGVGTAVDWFVEAEAEDYVPATSEKMRLKAGEVKEVALVLTGGATLSGFVVGEGGKRLAGARLRVGTLEGDDVTRPNLSAWQVDRMLDPRVFVSDEEGRFLIPNIKPGRVAVKAEHPDFVTFFKRNLTLLPDAVQENYSVILPRGEVCEGVVKGVDGRPIEGAFVIVTAQRNPGAQAAEPAGSEPGESVEPAMNGRSDRDGKFRVENIPPGTYSVLVGFAAGHVGWFGTNDESAIVRDVNVPAHDVEFRLKVQELPATPGFGPRPEGTPRPPPR